MTGILHENYELLAFQSNYVEKVRVPMEYVIDQWRITSAVKLITNHDQTLNLRSTYSPVYGSSPAIGSSANGIPRNA